MGVSGGVILIIVAVLIGITIRRRRLGKQDRFPNLPETRQNPNTMNENSHENPVTPPGATYESLTHSSQPHIADPYEILSTDSTYAHTVQRQM